jgi:hypothetical protein
VPATFDGTSCGQILHYCQLSRARHMGLVEWRLRTTPGTATFPDAMKMQSRESRQDEAVQPAKEGGVRSRAMSYNIIISSLN